MRLCGWGRSSYCGSQIYLPPLPDKDVSSSCLSQERGTMFSKFKYEALPLSSITLDYRNPRIVTQVPLKTQDEIVAYLFEHENLAAFLKKISIEGKNVGAERPYVIKQGAAYVVIEGNTRIAAYKLLTGQLQPPSDFAKDVPLIPETLKDTLRLVDCTIAPSRDALLPIMASAHFGLGDKSKWGYLGSRKAVYDEWRSGKSIAQLANAFDRKKGQIRTLILEYLLYLHSLKLGWTAAEKAVLDDPSVEFNPPIRFLETSGHKSGVGIEFDRVNLEVLFAGKEAKNKFKHLVRKLVVNPEKGLGATASYKDVFGDYKPLKAGETPGDGEEGGDTGGGGAGGGEEKGEPGAAAGTKLKPGALFNYEVTSNSLLLAQLMKEARDINSKTLPAAATFLIRSIMEAILKHIIDDQKGNPQNKLISLETALDLCMGKGINLLQDDKNILKEFKKSHLDYVNLGSHATVIPNHLRVMAVRDCVDQFVKRNI